MRYFNIKVNGKEYSVEVEETGVSSAHKAAPKKAEAVAATEVKAAPKAAEAAPAIAGGSKVAAPMPGLIIKHLVENGAQVKKNQKILILESMKMENDILASADGVITFVKNAGEKVDTGETLAVVK